jgi:hypothetical protein
MTKILKVGFDFDGVVAYNPFRVIRAPVTFLKQNILGVKKLQFWYPQKRWQQIFWTILHESSVFPAKGVDLLKEVTKEEKIEAHLVTARYSFLDDRLYNWLDRHNLRKIFKTINLNKKDEQPHLFKEKIIEKYKLDIFIEDNLDIVNHLHKKKWNTRIFWIYNLLDRWHPHPYKYPFLEKAIEEIVRQITDKK